MPPPPIVASRSLAPPTFTDRAQTPVESAVFPSSPTSSRPDLDGQVRALLARSGNIAQRRRVERQEFDERLVNVLCLLTQLTEERRFLEERVAVLEGRLAVVERVGANAGDLTLSRAEQFDNRLGRLERSFIGRRHLREG
jgi:methyl-accepting chemotaxis protein